jgi:hypothetical protein
MRFGKVRFAQPSSVERSQLPSTYPGLPREGRLPPAPSRNVSRLGLAVAGVLGCCQCTPNTALSMLLSPVLSCCQQCIRVCPCSEPQPPELHIRHGRVCIAVQLGEPSLRPLGAAPDKHQGSRGFSGARGKAGWVIQQAGHHIPCVLLWCQALRHKACAHLKSIVACP